MNASKVIISDIGKRRALLQVGSPFTNTHDRLVLWAHGDGCSGSDKSVRVTGISLDHAQRLTSRGTHRRPQSTGPQIGQWIQYKGRTVDNCETCIVWKPRS